VVRFDAVDAPNEQRISELEEERDRLARERERFVGRSRAIGDLAIPAAHREATRQRLKNFGDRAIAVAEAPRIVMFGDGCLPNEGPSRVPMGASVSPPTTLFGQRRILRALRQLGRLSQLSSSC